MALPSTLLDLDLAHQHAAAGRFAQMLAACQRVLDTSDPTDKKSAVARVLDVGALLSGYGFLSDAQACYAHALRLAPTDLSAHMNLANLARDRGMHESARQGYAHLLHHLPNHPIIRRNALVGLEYDPNATAPHRFEQARAWGQWATARVGAIRPRPSTAPFALGQRLLRCGYVSADLCQHTVGLFVQAVLQAHDPQRVEVFAYSAGSVKDGVSRAIASVCTVREVASMNDERLAECIRADAIDVLIDLSGHTAGSRLTVFAHRPAPVLLSWLGYFATTGLACMDGVLLDDGHAPAGTEAQFIEPIVRLTAGRFCYQPVPWAPAQVAPPPCLANGYITFGSFNNSAKFNDGVWDVWAQVLAAVPDSRLILKWRTFNDAAYRQQVMQAFVQRGIASERVQLRGPSFHAEVLKEYADLDIALDPFPFTGGLTSCEALWMGVPVITWPQERAVSRQTWALLHQIGIAQWTQAWAAHSAADYVQKAAALAHDHQHLVQLRAALRPQMQASALMDVASFTRQLEEVFIQQLLQVQQGTSG